MAFSKKQFYNVLVSRYGNDDGGVIEHRFFIDVDYFSDWLKCKDVDLQRCEVLIRDIEYISFDSVSPPHLIQLGD